MRTILDLELPTVNEIGRSAPPHVRTGPRPLRLANFRPPLSSAC